MAKNRIKIRVPGKIIISGEHAVVYGHPAIVAAVNRFVTISLTWSDDLDRQFFKSLLDKFDELGVMDVINAINSHIDGHSALEITSEIPIGCGMGSSAAIAAALSQLVLMLSKEPHDLETVNRYAFKLEKHAHGNPSGADNTIVTHGGLIQYQRSSEGAPSFSALPHSSELEHIFIVNTGTPKETTAEMVAKVKQFGRRDENKLKMALDDVAKATGIVRDVITQKAASANLGDAFKLNERALESLGVVSSSCQKFVGEITVRGGAAKISGAGGLDGSSGIVLVYPGDKSAIQEYIKTTGFECWKLAIDGGLKYEISAI